MLKFTKTNRFNEVMGMIRHDGIPDAAQVMFSSAVNLGNEFHDGHYCSMIASPLPEKGGSRAHLTARYDDNDEIVILYQGIPLAQTVNQKPGAMMT